MKKITQMLLFYILGATTLYCQTGLSVHGYLNQAFAFTDGSQVFGIPKEGTTDYRNLALQFRYDLNENSNFVIQFSHKRVGLNPLMEIEEDVRLDWGYFEYIFDNNFSAKVGKIQMPFGNYNEYRDVGVLHPFYSVPYSPYGEGNYMSETVDGLLVSYETDAISNWLFDIDIYGGHWIWQEWFAFNFPGSGLTHSIGNIQVNNGIGGQLYVGTPLEGLEFRFGGQYAEPIGGVSFTNGGYFGKQMEMYLLISSFKWEFQHGFVSSDLMNVGFLDHPANPLTYNIQLGVHLIENIDINVQYEKFSVYNFTVPVYLRNIVGKNARDIDFNTDYAIGLKYKVSSHFVIKAETHWNEGYLVENKMVDAFLNDPAKTQYTIFSIATSF